MLNTLLQNPPTGEDTSYLWFTLAAIGGAILLLILFFVLGKKKK